MCVTSVSERVGVFVCVFLCGWVGVGVGGACNLIFV